MDQNDTQQVIVSGKTVLGVEFGSTRIKAVLIGEDRMPIATGSHEWENRHENGVWTYSLEDVWNGLQTSFGNLSKEVLETDLEGEPAFVAFLGDDPLDQDRVLRVVLEAHRLLRVADDPHRCIEARRIPGDVLVVVLRAIGIMPARNAALKSVVEVVQMPPPNAPVTVIFPPSISLPGPLPGSSRRSPTTFQKSNVPPAGTTVPSIFVAGASMFPPKWLLTMTR